MEEEAGSMSGSIFAALPRHGPAAKTAPNLRFEEASLKHFGDWWSFMECLDLFLLFATALGITSTIVLAEFYESFVYDNLRLRNHGRLKCQRPSI